jgi:hypothetical protein
MASSLPTRRQREAMRHHRQMPHIVTQAEVMRQLKLTHSNDFYRLFYRCTITEAKEAYQKNEE